MVAMAKPPAGKSGKDRRAAAMWAAVSALCLIQFVDVMSVTVVVTALPPILADVGGSAGDSVLISASYAMFFGGLLMFGARLGDRFGHRTCILASLAITAVGSLMAAMADSALALAVARAVQGASAAVAVPAALALLIAVTKEGSVRARAIAAWSAAGAAAGGSGFIVGGLVARFGSWRLIFWGLLVVAVLLAVMVIILVPDDVLAVDGRSLNLLGSMLLTATVMLIVAGTTLAGDASYGLIGALLLVCACVTLVVFVRVDRRSSAPLLPRAEFSRPQVMHGTVGAFFNTATTGGAAILLTLYLQDTLGRSPLQTAYIFLPLSVLVVVGSAVAGKLIVRWRSERVAAVGLGLVAAGLGLPLLRPDAPVLLGASLAVVGCGLGLSSVATTSLATDVPAKPRTTDAGIVNTSAQLGTAVGIAVVLSVASWTGGVSGSDTGVPYVAWGLTAVLAAIVALSFFVVHTRRRRGELHTVRRSPALRGWRLGHRRRQPVG